MRNISDIIEYHLKQNLEKSQKGYIEIQRSELADQFQCVPSQINYVINTRFTVEKGYLVESKRGGGGFIRIRKVQLIQNQDLLQTILELIGDHISQATAEDMLDRLFDSRIISERENRLMKAVIHRNVLSFQVQVRDQLRAKMMQAMLVSLLYK
ncbi:CtsR family transcriptional regulator [Bacillus horti]|uniref:Transcriptional regulator CtsR n=1 Tax=Caldalkalibacillus horti TaxID=77523 RepID=A0ABT9VYG1_9BACI|nr:CtsR family transcriptional regulator [Bacillus horti]MDQ0166030.1 transcriptional regulator CtsR [Bacillus horti]